MGEWDFLDWDEARRMWCSHCGREYLQLLDYGAQVGVSPFVDLCPYCHASQGREYVFERVYNRKIEEVTDDGKCG